MILIDDFYKLFNNAVRFYPITSLNCLRPQTFAVLDSMSNLSTPNLAKVLCDKNKPYFYSRIWEDLKYNPSQLKFDYPLVVVFELNGDATDLFSSRQKTCYNLQLMVVDSYKEEKCRECVDCNSCESRTINEIYRDTETILYNILSYLSDLIVTTSGLVLNLQHFNALNVLTPNSLTKDAAKSNKLNDGLRKSNLNNLSFRFEGKGVDNLYGTVINLKVCLDKCNDENMYNDIEILNNGEVNDIGCC